MELGIKGLCSLLAPWDITLPLPTSTASSPAADQNLPAVPPALQDPAPEPARATHTSAAAQPTPTRPAHVRKIPRAMARLVGINAPGRAEAPLSQRRRPSITPSASSETRQDGATEPETGQ